MTRASTAPRMTQASTTLCTTRASAAPCTTRANAAPNCLSQLHQLLLNASLAIVSPHQVYDRLYALGTGGGGTLLILLKLWRQFVGCTLVGSMSRVVLGLSWGVRALLVL